MCAAAPCLADSRDRCCELVVRAGVALADVYLEFREGPPNGRSGQPGWWRLHTIILRQLSVSRAGGIDDDEDVVACPGVGAVAVLPFRGRDHRRGGPGRGGQRRPTGEHGHAVERVRAVPAASVASSLARRRPGRVRLHFPVPAWEVSAVTDGAHAEPASGHPRVSG
jgi:hypothetical protein